MSPDEIQRLELGLEKLKGEVAVFKTWTESHDKRSTEHWNGIRERLDEIKTSISGLVTKPEYVEHKENIRWHISRLWTSLAGQTATFVAVIGLLAGWLFIHISGGSK